MWGTIRLGWILWKMCDGKLVSFTPSADRQIYLNVLEHIPRIYAFKYSQPFTWL